MISRSLTDRVWLDSDRLEGANSLSIGLVDGLYCGATGSHPDRTWVIILPVPIPVFIPVHPPSPSPSPAPNPGLDFSQGCCQVAAWPTRPD
jgi:hypothetical protein